MPESTRRYTFHPLERRGVLLGLQAGQIAVLFGGVAGALVAGHALPPPAGPEVAVVVLLVAAAGALWRRAGRPVAGWAPIAAGWAARRSRAVVAPRPAGPVPAAGPPGIGLVEVAALPGEGVFGAVRDRRSGCWAAVVPVKGRSFVLLDADDQVAQLEAWRAVLGTLGRPASPVRRVQWVHRSTPVGGEGLVGAAARLPPGAGGDSYRQLVGTAAAVTQCHQAWMVLAVGGFRGRGRPGDRAVDELRREVRLLDGHLRNADLQAGPPLEVAALAGLFAAAHAGDAGRGDRPRRRPWPMATDESWAALRADGTWHATYWVAEWPRVEVNPDFLSPLLLGPGRRTVSVVMAPVPADRAAREVRAARAADVADEELRSRAGFLPSARRGREADGVVRREAELADGHAEYRFSGYVTVSATDREGLEKACVETEQAAQRAHLELARLYGRQAEAYTWTLPLGRGLA